MQNQDNIVADDGQDPAHDWRELIDAQYLPTLPRWHRSFGGETHVTVEELERLETDIQTAKSWTGGDA